MPVQATIYKFNLNTTTVQDVDLWLVGRNVLDIQWSQDYLTILVQDI